MDDFFNELAVEQMPDVSIDLETMGTRANAPIVAIGAVAFSFAEMKLGERFYANVDLSSCVAQGAVVDPGTVIWWMKQSDDARAKLTRGEIMPVAEFLVAFSAWLDKFCVGRRDRRVWACGTDFDNVILSEHYRRAGIEVPWEFWNNRDQRTVRELFKSTVEGMQRQGTHHNALDDAIFQVEQLFAIRRKLRGGK